MHYYFILNFFFFPSQGLFILQRYAGKHAFPSCACNWFLYPNTNTSACTIPSYAWNKSMIKTYLFSLIVVGRLFVLFWACKSQKMPLNIWLRPSSRCDVTLWFLGQYLNGAQCRSKIRTVACWESSSHDVSSLYETVVYLIKWLHSNYDKVKYSRKGMCYS